MAMLQSVLNSLANVEPPTVDDDTLQSIQEAALLVGISTEISERITSENEDEKEAELGQIVDFVSYQLQGKWSRDVWTLFQHKLDPYITVQMERWLDGHHKEHMAFQRIQFLVMSQDNPEKTRSDITLEQMEIFLQRLDLGEQTLLSEIWSNLETNPVRKATLENGKEKFGDPMLVAMNDKGYPIPRRVVVQPQRDTLSLFDCNNGFAPPTNADPWTWFEQAGFNAGQWQDKNEEAGLELSGTAVESTDETPSIVLTKVA